MSVTKRFEDEFDRHPILRSLLQLVPFGVGAGLDTAISGELEKMRQERVATLFRELRDGERDLTPELVRTEDFLQAFFATTSASLRTKNLSEKW